MSRIPTKHSVRRRKPPLSLRRKGLPFPRRSSYLEPSAETLASMNEDASKLPRYKTADELIASLEHEPSK